MVSASSGLSQGARGPLALMQWRHSRLHQVPVIWIHSAVSPTKGARGADATGAGVRAGGVIRRASFGGPVLERPVVGSVGVAGARAPLHRRAYRPRVEIAREHRA